MCFVECLFMSLKAASNSIHSPLYIPSSLMRANNCHKLVDILGRLLTVILKLLSIYELYKLLSTVKQ